ncbi:hypothetical protein COR50_11605 [Chitinophaga caeni]|uniref:Iron dicitrate transport regulator FecR n=1 Tax=Chitinophaga caeni TaxID=2029983 RepID=A0A291QUY9_9BACT|nr:FecR family protein [Chitinophaga caeni]ATL47756.1 hypothetical protein COR50_11605 [Chitinophaga caeni]
MEQKGYYIDLFNRLLEGNCSPTDTEVLLQWLGSEEQDPLAASLILEEFNKSASSTDIDPAVREMLAAKLPGILKQEEVRIVQMQPRHDWRKWLGIAATVLLLAGSAFFWRWYSGQDAKTAGALSKQVDILPGSDKAILTLDDGKQVVLDSNGHINIQQGNTAVQQLSGVLQYEAAKSPGSKEIAYNRLSTPRGGQFQLVLPDGTKAFLNAVSSIRFPTAFTGNERLVEIEGQVNFDIAQDASKPFIVKTRNTRIEALGTSFDVMAYADEPTINTTLESGAVKVSIESTGESVVLQPGKQAIVNAKTEKMQVKSVNVNKIVAWKNGYFILDNDPVQTIMRQIQRWYDVDVKYEDGFSVEHISGEIPRDYTLVEVLKVMDICGVKCELEGRTIIVKK